MARKTPDYQKLGLTKVGPGKYRDAAGNPVSERQYRAMKGKPAKGSPGYTSRPKTGSTTNPGGRRGSPVGNKAERRAIPSDSSLWTPRQKEIVRNFISRNPYDATLESLHGKKVASDYSMPEERTLDNLEKKLDVLSLKYKAGLITKREYQRMEKAIERIANRVPDVYRYAVGSPQYRAAVDAIAADYAKLRDGSTPQKRLVMTTAEWQAHQDALDELDIYHEIFYH